MNIEDINVDALRPLLPLPLWQKIAGLSAVVLLIMGLYINFGLKPLLDEITTEESQVQQQKDLLVKNQRLASDLPKKREEFDKLEIQLKAALSMLPKQSQIPDLLESVSRSGVDSGLEFSTFSPKNEKAQPLYAEVPVDVSLTGSFRQFLTFLKRVGELPRIVAVKNVEMSRQGDGAVISVKGNVMTYRFVEQSDKTKVTAKKKQVSGR
ncbi:MAG: pilus assembly protein PilO [Zetaproteobacteria bacterium CG_4_9_14_3_um_filter_49_83]|nr:MAG: pilus assembly protein PilO [Zetaproteobacteria bacterium CG1_02_49_23]PIQ30003.1 MAG: pilus assembly protein PilO [Zetaproteobacteria bacterium CG17_big_fil_post_rev_8_21_14_2_50_50_13]PIV30373.1 MAG: pilus assembly protein PilO [Zetaproteobacteria bacterium CG02_land_8_20_14_3_00_50_9]PIY56049.1 MAG: pilus assembly protein PilO [Zetaproteobacteria bacterium CG_4_10_14_0_8_um_filter_49_80]PJA36275.1 MAG: pilus assembly protein PilO [Zetaproteobacteria bacterium CG_4_9_14_3_um_filter_49